MAAGALVIDIRPVDQRERDGELPGAVVIDRNVLEWRLDPSSPHRIDEAADEGLRVIVVCNQGYSSSLAAATLRRLGLQRATDLVGGFQAWREVMHWQRVYGQRDATDLSWYQERPSVSIELIEGLDVPPDGAVIDVGGGSSSLAGDLLALGFRDVTVLDLSPAALEAARERVGGVSSEIEWVAADVRTWEPSRHYALWHDRAAFHFLVEGDDRKSYVDCIRNAVAPGGFVIIAAFAEDGPERCSGLPVMRYEAGQLATAMGPDFAVVTSRREEHVTPNGDVQPFTWLVLQKDG